ncbi:hypothetical protein Rsub_09140 [Raphidocelis subcapitata]|uniref:Uncharacterized protein n=1 Tax=Raphidocelis subcapitata TaxID=307507 RepID=A0A2V0PH74_9CHLO|nr:hypothetical protein Rsub_09140 [Raphidocelis subcapitata]|eukprot:GBF96557.1 hypothetical protein Rsub_09140 [Raphidocelis subcapitata]
MAPANGTGLISFPTTGGSGPAGDGGVDDPLLHYSEPPSPVAEAPRARREPAESLPRRAAAAWRWLVHGPPRQPRYRSGYLTLIPLSDARLQPRRTRLMVGLGLLLALLIAGGVFVSVPRGVSIGTLDMHSTHMHFNGSTMNYRIILGAKVPVLNPNFFSARVTGNLSISFYDADAGWKAFGPVDVPARSFPSEVHVKVDASNLPGKYTAVVIGCCLNFPRKLIFFLTASFKVDYMMWSYDLPLVDSYFMLDCSDADADALGGGEGGDADGGGGGGGFPLPLRRVDAAAASAALRAGASNHGPGV